MYRSESASVASAPRDAAIGGARRRIDRARGEWRISPVAPASGGYAPTVLANVPDDAMILHQEPFGPIARYFRSRMRQRCSTKREPGRCLPDIAPGACARSGLENLLDFLVLYVSTLDQQFLG